MFFGGRTRTMVLACLVGACAPVLALAAAPRYTAQVVNAELVGGLRVEGPDAVLLAWGSDATILRSADGRTWRHADTPGFADLTQLAADASGAVLVAVGAKGTILRSTDSGRSWLPARNKITDTDLQAVICAGERTWLAAGSAGRILRSVDDGRSWSVIDTRLQVTLRTLDRDQGRVLIGGDGGLVGSSTDRGESWQVTMIQMPDPVTPVSGFHRFGPLLLARSALGRFLTSEDNGASWDLMQSSSQAFYTDAAEDPDHGVIVMTGHNGDLLRSRDGGRNWEGGEVALDGRKTFLSTIHHDPRGHALLVTGQSGMVARSTDGGITWRAANGSPGGEVRGLIDDGTRGGLIAFGAGGLLASSTDSGLNWTMAREPLDFPMREVAATPRGDALVATSRLGDLLRSTDSGANWRPVTPVYPNAHTPPDLRNLVASPAGDAMIAAGPPGAILRGDADGTGWRVVLWHDIEAERAFPGLLVDASHERLLAVEGRGAMMTSRDSGASWRRGDVPLAIEAGKFPFWHGAALADRDLLVVAGEGGRAARSTDGGASWQVIVTGTTDDLYGSYADGDRLWLAGANGTLLESTDQAATWRAVRTGTRQELRRVFRVDDQVLLCFGAHGTLLRSSNDGREWRAVTTGTDGVLRKLILEPVTGNLLIAGSQGALLRSADGGRSWEKLETHTTRHFNGAAVAHRTGDLVLVGERIVRLVRR